VRGTTSVRPIRPVIAVTVCLTTGCAGMSGWKPSFFAGPSPTEQTAYGTTADQRIEALAAAAKRVEAASSAERVEFTRQLVRDMLEEHDPRVRCAILDAAAGFDTPSALAICRGALEDPDERVRMAACTAWRRRGGPEAVELLGARFHADAEMDVRLRAIRELGDLGDKEAIPVLARALEDPDPAVQYRAVGALKQVSGRDLGDDVNAWRQWAANPDADAVKWSIAEGFRQLF